MFRDPLYWQIRRHLRELTDGKTFEECANDLLRQIYPSLAPREGGDDAGLDGVAVGEQSKSIQLICTVGKDVLRNLSDSIRANIEKHGASHACIFATSQRLTNPKKRTLEDRAKELGRPLLQIYDQAGIAPLLYRDARWLKELLGLSGDPAPLSLFPLSGRPFFDVPPIGRDGDLAVIANATNDTVLIGQPGSGKTHLLFNAAKSSKGRFVLEEDVTRIAEGLRAIQPRFIIVDDAHSRLDFLKRLRLLRQQTGSNFAILASCWPGQEDAVLTALQTRNHHKLEGLPVKQIKELVNSQKIFGPDHLVAEIIHQSQGKPGLCVTLCRLCWEVGAGEVMWGNALARDTKRSIESVLGQDAMHLLACFAIGGDMGMTLEDVAPLVGKSPLEAKRMAEQLGAAGVLDVARESRICVNPLRLRQVLVRDTFLKPPILDVSPYIVQADPVSAARILIQAKLFGGQLPDDFIRKCLEGLDDSDPGPFVDYAYAGEEEAEWVLQMFPNHLVAVAEPALAVCPLMVIPMLLQSDEAQAFSKIQKWILSATGSEVFNRREALATSLQKWFGPTSDIAVAVNATTLVLSIRYENTSNPPGEAATITMHFGIASRDQLAAIASLWPKVLPVLRHAKTLQGSQISDIFHQWIHPSFHFSNATKEYENESRQYARRMMSELLQVYSGNWTMHHHLRHYAEKLGLHASVKLDPIAEVLYPSNDQLDWNEAEIIQKTAAEQLAHEWSTAEPRRVVEILVKYEKEAGQARISRSYPWDCHICCCIAQQDNCDAARWLPVLFESGASDRLIKPFLNHLAATQPNLAEPWIVRALDRDDLRALGIFEIVRYYAPESKVWQDGSACFNDFLAAITDIAILKGAPAKNIQAILRFSERSVRASMALAVWHANRPAIPADLLDAWKSAIIDDDDSDHILQDVFSKFPELAFKWIDMRVDGIRDGTKPFFFFGGRYESAMPSAVRQLSVEQRARLIDKLPSSTAVSELIGALVGGDVQLFNRLLARKDLGRLRLSVFRIEVGSIHENFVPEFGSAWQAMALAALQNSFSPEDIFSATQEGRQTWSGSMSSMYAAQLKPFETLLRHADAGIKSIGQVGVNIFSNQRDEWQEREKRAAIAGKLC